MDGPKNPPTVPFVFDDHPKAHEVEDLIKLSPSHHHLFVDAPEVLPSTSNVSFNPKAGESILEFVHHLGHDEFSLGGSSGHHLLNFGVALWVQGGKGEIFQLPLNLLDSKTVREWGVDVQGLLRCSALLPLWEDGNGPHVVEAIRQFDDQDSPIGRHGEKHFSNRCRLLRFL